MSKKTKTEPVEVDPDVDLFEDFDAWTFEELDTMLLGYERASKGQHVECAYDINYYAGAEQVFDIAHVYCLGLGWAKDKMTTAQLRQKENFDRFWVQVFEDYADRKHRLGFEGNLETVQRTAQYYIGALDALRLLRAYRGKGDGEE